VIISATGIDASEEISVVIGAAEVVPQSIVAAPGLAGVYQILLNLPSVLPTDDTMAVFLKIRVSDGSEVVSNKVSVATQELQ
jgi:uncharacterized protein (TIGR03437 family)